MIGRIHSLESFGTVDGPGARYVVFLQGCLLRCKYCHNPDTWEIAGGSPMTADEILSKYDKVKNFLKNGGLTVTGGEPLLQIDFVTELFTKAKRKGIHTCLDTSGVTFRKDKNVIEKMNRLLEVTDLVMLDIKHIDLENHKELTGLPNDNILEFLRFLSTKDVEVWIRHVVVPGITDKKEWLYKLGVFLGDFDNINGLDVLPYHTMGEVKYESLGIPYPLKGLPALEKEDAVNARKIILEGMKKRVLERRSLQK